MEWSSLAAEGWAPSHNQQINKKKKTNNSLPFIQSTSLIERKKELCCLLIEEERRRKDNSFHSIHQQQSINHQLKIDWIDWNCFIDSFHSSPFGGGPLHSVQSKKAGSANHLIHSFFHSSTDLACFLFFHFIHCWLLSRRSSSL